MNEPVTAARKRAALARQIRDGRFVVAPASST